MPHPLVLPRSTVALARKIILRGSCHPGLQLDKFSEVGDQADQKAALEQVIHARGDASFLNDVQQRRQQLLSTLPGMVWWQCQTTGPLTLHLARASALENAGICLHPLYGFVYLPGSGLKGMAQAYAKTIWLPTQSDQRAAWRLIEDVFGWAPNRDRQQQLGNPQHPAERRYECDDDLSTPEIPAHTGALIFHDAWPTTWPCLMLDIVNNHHGDYYAARPDDPQHAPGDWENPVPVYFLAVGAGVSFTFAISKRRKDVPDNLVALARQWLTGALCYLGAGAKTAAGYGSFALLAESEETKTLAETVQHGWQSALEATTHRDFTSTLELVTPAFLAGASQQQQDCDLRSATLRGVLRWWWRTLHAGQVEVSTLRWLEAAVWGNTENGGPVRVTVEPAAAVVPAAYNYKNQYRPKPEFQQAHTLQNPPNNKTTQGLFYISYGMDEVSHGARKQRWYAPPGARWTVRVTAHAGRYEERNDQGKVLHSQTIPAAYLLDQARAALWLLCHFGGVGSKAHRGFGSFTIPENLAGMTLDTCQEMARHFRDACGIREHLQSAPESSALTHLLPPLEVITPWKDCWFALDQLGFSIQAFAQRYKHDLVKKALGLPRRIPGPSSRLSLAAHQDDRHASPVHYHINKGTDGNLIIRVVAFPAKHLPDLQTSHAFLSELLAHLAMDLTQRIKAHAHTGQTPPTSSVDSSGTPVRPNSGPGKRLSGTAVMVTILEKRPKGGYAVQEAGKARGTLTVGREPTPSPQEGAQVQVLIHDDNPRNPQYRWGEPPSNTGKSSGTPRGQQRGGSQRRR